MSSSEIEFFDHFNFNMLYEIIIISNLVQIDNILVQEMANKRPKVFEVSKVRIIKVKLPAK